MDTPKVEPLDPEFEEAWKVYSRFIALMNRPRLQKAGDGLYYLPANRELTEFLDLFKTQDDPVYWRSTRNRIKTTLAVASSELVQALIRDTNERGFTDLGLTWEAYNAKFKEEVKKVSALAKELYEVAKPIMQKWKEEVPNFFFAPVPSKRNGKFLALLWENVVRPWNETVTKEGMLTIPLLCMRCGRPVLGRANQVFERGNKRLVEKLPAEFCSPTCAKRSLEAT
jgi:hypothetical protein